MALLTTLPLPSAVTEDATVFALPVAVDTCSLSADVNVVVTSPAEPAGASVEADATTVRVVDAC